MLRVWADMVKEMPASREALMDETGPLADP